MKRVPITTSLISSYITVETILNNITDCPEFRPIYDPQLTQSFEKLLHSIDLFTLRPINLTKYLLCFRKEPRGPSPITQHTLSRYYTIIGPLGALQDTEELLRRASPSSFGLGSETVFDPSVRSAKELKAADFVLLCAESYKEIELKKFSSSLSWYLDKECTFTLKKLNIYGPGDFFAVHKDTPRSKMHIGTLVIVLEHPKEGGEFVVYDSFGKEKIVETDGETNGVIIYTDVEHEVRKVISGRRITLTVDIEWNGTGEDEESAMFEDGRSRLFRTITPRKRDSVEVPESQMMKERVEEICEGISKVVGGAQYFGVLLYHEYVKGVGKNCLKGIDKDLYQYFEKKGCKVSICPMIIKKTEVCGENSNTISFYRLPRIFVNPSANFNLEEFQEEHQKKREAARTQRLLRNSHLEENEEEEEEEEVDGRDPLVVFTLPQMKLIKHIEGAEYTGNEGMNEEHFYYITAITVRLNPPPKVKKPSQDDKPSQPKDDKPSQGNEPSQSQDDKPSQGNEPSR